MSTPHHHEADCVFCKIIQNKIQAVKIYEDDATLAFLDIGPAIKGHVLVVPKDHFENIYSIPAELWCRVMLTVQKVALAIKNALSADGINIMMNNEGAAGQVVFHAHVHVIPRENEDGLIPWPHKSYESDDEAETFGKKIIEALER